MTLETTPSPITPLSIEESRARRKMSRNIGLILGALVISFFVVTIVRLQANMTKRAELNKKAPANISTSVKSDSLKPMGKPAGQKAAGDKGQAH